MKRLWLTFCPKKGGHMVECLVACCNQHCVKIDLHCEMLWLDWKLNPKQSQCQTTGRCQWATKPAFKKSSISLTLVRRPCLLSAKKGWSHHVNHMAECLVAFCNQRVFRFAREAPLMMRQIGKFWTLKSQCQTTHCCRCQWAITSAFTKKLNSFHCGE